MSSTEVCDCGRPTDGQAQLCRRCTDWLARELGDVRSLADELETTRLRQSRTGGQGIGVSSRSPERPLPWDDRPVVAAAELRVSLVGWVRVVVDGRALSAWPADTLPAMAALLLRHLEWVREQEWAGEAKTDVERHVRRLRSTVDRRAEQVFAGPCGAMDYWPGTTDLVLCSAPCAGDVYSAPNARVGTCRTCGAEHETAGRRQWLLEAVADQLAYVAQLSKALSNLGSPVPDPTIRSWVDRGRLVPHGEDSQGRKLYRVGDVVDLLVETAHRSHARRSA